MLDVGIHYLHLNRPLKTSIVVEHEQGYDASLYILDEPTTGLHFQDIQHLLAVLNKLVDKGNTVLIIEHNLDIIKVADHVIDIGPEAGQQGRGYA